MNNITKAALTILVTAAVLVYTFFNYANGKINAAYLLVFVVIPGIPLLNMVNILIQELKKDNVKSSRQHREGFLTGA